MKIYNMSIRINRFGGRWLFLDVILYWFYPNWLIGKWFTETDQGRRWALSALFWQKIMGINRNIPWPTGPNVRINNPNNIEFDPDDLNNFWSLGLFLDATHAKIHIGKNTVIGPFTTITTTERDFKYPAVHNNWAPIYIGNN